MGSTFRKYKVIERFILILISGSCLVLAWFLIRDIYLLADGSYKVVPENLVRIDSIESGGIVNDHGRSQLVYEAENGLHFRITGDSYQSITYPAELIDLLRRSGFLFSVFTDRKGIEYFRSGKKYLTIEIYQLIIRRRAYINIYKTNELERKKLTWRSVSMLIAIGVLLYAIYSYKKRTKKMQQSSAKIINL